MPCWMAPISATSASRCARSSRSSRVAPGLIATVVACERRGLGVAAGFLRVPAMRARTPSSGNGPAASLQAVHRARRNRIGRRCQTADERKRASAIHIEHLPTYPSDTASSASAGAIARPSNSIGIWLGVPSFASARRRSLIIRKMFHSSCAPRLTVDDARSA